MATGPGTRPISARRAATRERLLGAARQVFAERGIHGASVEDICDAAGFSRGAFYSNFASKQELLVALLRHEHDTVMARVTAAVDRPTGPPAGGDAIDAIDAIDAVAQRFFAAYPLDRQGLLVHGEFRQHALRDPWTAQLLQQKHAEMHGEMTALLQTALTRAGRRLTVDPDDAIDAVAAVFEAAVAEMHLREVGGTGGDALDVVEPSRRLGLIVRALSEPVG